MRYIKKIGTESECDGVKQTKAFLNHSWRKCHGYYNNITYNRSKLGYLPRILVNEQEGYCCYCMRKLYLRNTSDGHKANVTLEHIIPNKIQKNQWNREKFFYQQFPNLYDAKTKVFYGGSHTGKEKINKKPFPHFVSYYNLVASCNGIIFEEGELKEKRCCNNKRGNNFVLPIFLRESLANGIIYLADGELDYDDATYKSEWFDKDHLNLENSWIVLVRKLWYRIAKSGYTINDIENARTDKDLRQDIIDDIDTDNKIAAWATNDDAWNLLSEYSWFYQYYY